MLINVKIIINILPINCGQLQIPDSDLNSSNLISLMFEINVSAIKGYAWAFPSKGDLLNIGIGVPLSVFKKEKMDIKNLLVAQRTSFDTFTGVNAGKTTHPGLEATINFPLLRSQNLNITSSNNFSKYWYVFKDFNNNDIDYSQNKLTGVPTHTTNSKVKINFKNYLAQMSLQNVGKIPMNDSNELFSDAYSVINFKISKLFSFKNFDMNISSGINELDWIKTTK